MVVLIILFDQPKGEELDLIIILTFKAYIILMHKY